MKTAFLLAIGWTLAAAAQTVPKNLDLNFPNLAASAAEKSEVDLDGATLAAAQASIVGNDSGPISGTKAIRVREYKFSAEGAYKDADLDPLRQQVAADHTWSSIVRVKNARENTGIFVLNRENGDRGLLIISTEAKQVTVVEMLGTVDLKLMKEVVQSTIRYDQTLANVAPDAARNTAAESK